MAELACRSPEIRNIVLIFNWTESWEITFQEVSLAVVNVLLPVSHGNIIGIMDLKISGIPGEFGEFIQIFSQQLADTDGVQFTAIPTDPRLLSHKFSLHVKPATGVDSVCVCTIEP